jgi:2'-phosphotransferase
MLNQKGLSRMNRQHIHFAVDLPGSDQVISGMRSNCTIAIFIDVNKALEGMINF